MARYIKTKQINGKRKYFYGKTPSEAKKKAEAYNGIIGSAVLPVKTAMDAWLTEYVSKLSKATYDQYNGLSGYITDIIGNIKVNKVLPLNCQDVINQAARHDLSSATLKHIRKVMHTFFEHERVMKKTIKENPCHDLKMPKGKPTRSRRAATPEELALIWERTSGTHYFYCYQFLLLTGLRPSEVCGIRVSDTTGDFIAIKEARTRTDVSTGKSDNAARTIKISPNMRLIIGEQKKYLMKKGLASSKYLFPTPDGEPSNSGYLTRAWGRLMHNTDIELTLYELRHTLVSAAYDKVPLKELQSIIGHSSSMDTSKTYAHIFKSKSNTSDIIDEAIAPYLPKKLTTL